MKGEVKGQWNAGETGHKSGPGQPVEYLGGAWGPTVLPQLSLNRRSNLVLPRRNGEGEQSPFVLHLPCRWVASNPEGGLRDSQAALLTLLLQREAFLGEQPGEGGEKISLSSARAH